MEFDLFATDYGTLPASYFAIGRITNVSELLRCDALYSLLRLCGVSEDENGELTSDWELFRSLCRVYPLLAGHPIQEQISDFLLAHFSIDEPLSDGSCERVWCAIALDLERRPRDGTAFLSDACGRWLCDTAKVPTSLPKSVKPILHANLLLEQKETALMEWRRMLRDTADVYICAGCDRIVLRLEAPFSFVLPDVYHVDSILQKKKHTAEEREMLTAQLFRELCEICLERNIVLLTELNCDFYPVGQLLEYAERTVGLPQMYLTASTLQTADRLIARMGQWHRNSMQLALRLSDYPSAEELRAAYRSVAARYPAGRLGVITAADLRRISAVQSRVNQKIADLF